MKKLREREKKVIPLFIMLAVVVLLTILLINIGEKPRGNINEYFQNQKESTLVRMRLNTFSSAVGFINNEMLSEFEKGNLNDKTVRIYHPYIKDTYVIVKVKDIDECEVFTMEDFLKRYPYKKFKNKT